MVEPPVSARRIVDQLLVFQVATRIRKSAAVCPQLLAVVHLRLVRQRADNVPRKIQAACNFFVVGCERVVVGVLQGQGDLRN